MLAVQWLLRHSCPDMVGVVARAAKSTEGALWKNSCEPKTKQTKAASSVVEKVSTSSVMEIVCSAFPASERVPELRVAPPQEAAGQLGPLLQEGEGEVQAPPQALVLHAVAAGVARIDEVVGRPQAHVPGSGPQLWGARVAAAPHHLLVRLHVQPAVEELGPGLDIVPVLEHDVLQRHPDIVQVAGSHFSRRRRAVATASPNVLEVHLAVHQTPRQCHVRAHPDRLFSGTVHEILVDLRPQWHDRSSASEGMFHPLIQHQIHHLERWHLAVLQRG
mmetsp:Transcript_103913/g.271313  ORF Transcript_103913/g.271313 Transcript_103913/m.271313 type:complete len:275 (+) Transcript_103913:103-927(+)